MTASIANSSAGFRQRAGNALPHRFRESLTVIESAWVNRLVKNKTRRAPLNEPRAFRHHLESIQHGDGHNGNAAVHRQMERPLLEGQQPAVAGARALRKYRHMNS